MDGPGFVLDPAAHDAAVDPCAGTGVAAGVEELVAVRSEIEVAALPAHDRRVEHGQERHPRTWIRYLRDVVRQQPARATAVECDCNGIEFGEGSPDDRLRRAQPPDDVVFRPRPEGVEPASDYFSVSVCGFDVNGFESDRGVVEPAQ